MHIVALLKSHLLETCGMDQLVAFVMPENVWSRRVLLRNDFVKEQQTEERHNWGGRETVTVEVYTYKRV